MVAEREEHVSSASPSLGETTPRTMTATDATVAASAFAGGEGSCTSSDALLGPLMSTMSADETDVFMGTMTDDGNDSDDSHVANVVTPTQSSVEIGNEGDASASHDNVFNNVNPTPTTLLLSVGQQATEGEEIEHSSSSEGDTMSTDEDDEMATMETGWSSRSSNSSTSIIDDSVDLISDDIIALERDAAVVGDGQQQQQELLGQSSVLEESSIPRGGLPLHRSASSPPDSPTTHEHGKKRSSSNDALAATSLPGLPLTDEKRRFSVNDTTPQWRFVSNAKKSEGYSSVSAGRIVRGHSSQELVKDYELPTNAKVVEKAIYGSSSSDDEHDIGEVREIHKLDLNEIEEKYEETHDGTFGGFKKRKKERNVEEFKWELQQVKLERENEMDELDTLNGETLEDPISNEAEGDMSEDAILSDLMDEELIDALRSVMELEKELKDAQLVKPKKHIAVAEMAPSVSTDEDDELDRVEKQTSAAMENKKTKHPITDSIPFPQSQQEAMPPKPISQMNEEENNDPKSNRVRYLPWGMCVVIILLLGTVGALLGVMLSSSGNSIPTSAPYLRGGEDTYEPTSAPTLSLPPTNDQSAAEIAMLPLSPEPVETITCPTDSKKFSLHFRLGQNPRGISWAIYDRCTLNFFYRCNNCYTDAPPNYPVSFGGCLPASYEETGIERGYVLQVSNFLGSPEYGYKMKYGDEFVVDADVGNYTNLQLNNFGDMFVSCNDALGLTEEPSAQPTISHEPTMQPSGSPTSSTRPTSSVQPSYQPTNIPTPQPSSNPSSSTQPTTLPPLRNIAHPPGSTIPCKEVIESELAGRIIDLDGEFCGVCQWKFSSFNCYQRVTFLITSYGMAEVSARQGLIDQGHCSVPVGFTVDEQWQLSQTVYCDGRPTPEPSSRPTRSPTVVPTSTQPNTPIPPLRNIAHPPDSTIPCKEVVESELAGRIIDLIGKFCGVCQWTSSPFNCYQRVFFLVTTYGFTEVSARQETIDQGDCGVPAAGFSVDEQWQLDATEYCDGRPTPEPTNQPTGSPIVEPTGNPILSQSTAELFG